MGLTIGIVGATVIIAFGVMSGMSRPTENVQPQERLEGTVGVYDFVTNRWVSILDKDLDGTDDRIEARLGGSDARLDIYPRCFVESSAKASYALKSIAVFKDNFKNMIDYTNLDSNKGMEVHMPETCLT